MQLHPHLQVRHKFLAGCGVDDLPKKRVSGQELIRGKAQKFGEGTLIVNNGEITVLV